MNSSDTPRRYGPTARWDGAAPPQPDFWMHQLGSPAHPRVRGPFLDPAIFAAHADSLLAPLLAMR
ncbi:MAG TPA: hypothetical protein VNW46_06825 [Gemmatimonadaceae bacterium]|nr:hypothetical protein [Gemmatimonadaceae bacterium]